MKTKRRLAPAVALGMVFSVSLFGQAMVGYGHGVARAGAAGAASGTGLAGIFSQIKDTSDDKDKRSSATAKAAQQGDAEAELTRADGEPANAPRKLTTSSGVVISGVEPTWMGAAYSDPVRQPVRVKTVAWSNPGEEQAAPAEHGQISTEGAGAVPAAADSSAAAAPEAAAGATASPGRIVRSSSEPFPGGAGGNAIAEPAAPALEPVTDAEVAGVRLGSSIDEVIRVLGRPTFWLTGIAGRSYTEKYVFKSNTGEKITVLIWNGAVTAVLVS